MRKAILKQAKTEFRPIPFNCVTPASQSNAGIVQVAENKNLWQPDL
jgi:hypothetical protein